MGRLGATELILILGLALVVFGPARLPEIGRALGKGIKEFKDHTNGVAQTVNEATLTEEKPKKDEA